MCRQKPLLPCRPCNAGGRFHCRAAARVPTPARTSAVDFEPWWLIFVPLLFALGWLAARFDIRQMLSETRVLPDSYFRGLNFLLNEEPDRAIDAFVEVAKLDPETTELHFALGSLFRRSRRNGTRYPRAPEPAQPCGPARRGARTCASMSWLRTS